MTPATYPATSYAADRWFTSPFNGWFSLADHPITDANDLRNRLIQAFEGDHVPATLATVKVWLRNDAGWRDVTEDVLRQIGDDLSRDCEYAAEFPDAFLSWASCEIQDERAAMNEARMDLDAAIAARREDAA